VKALSLILAAALCCMASTCQTFDLKVGAYYQSPDGRQIGASVELDPAFAKQKK
jgi:hypothetical protein